MTDPTNNEPERGMADVDSEIKAVLRTRYAAPGFPRAEIEDRLEESVRRSTVGRRAGVRGGMANPAFRAVLAAAAALVLFIGGAEYGRHTASPVAFLPESAFDSETGQWTLPLSIQTAGSDYIATLARYSDRSATLTEEERLEAQEVALAVLYGVVVELQRESGDDDMLATIAQLLHSRRQALRNPELEGAIWF